MSPPEPNDLWAALTTDALRRISELELEGAEVDAVEVADAVLTAFFEVPGADAARARLIAYVRDMAARR